MPDNGWKVITKAFACINDASESKVIETGSVAFHHRGQIGGSDESVTLVERLSENK